MLDEQADILFLNSLKCPQMWLDSFKIVENLTAPSTRIVVAGPLENAPINKVRLQQCTKSTKY